MKTNSAFNGTYGKIEPLPLKIPLPQYSFSSRIEIVLSEKLRLAIPAISHF